MATITFEVELKGDPSVADIIFTAGYAVPILQSTIDNIDGVESGTVTVDWDATDLDY